LYRFLRGLSEIPSESVFLIISNSVSGVFEGLINLPVTGSVYGLFSSLFKDKKFNSDVFFRIPKVFQKDVSLSGVLLELGLLTGSGVLANGQLLALMNFRVPSGS